MPNIIEIAHQCLHRHEGALQTWKSRCTPWSSRDLWVQKNNTLHLENLLRVQLASRGCNSQQIPAEGDNTNTSSIVPNQSPLTNLVMHGPFSQQLGVMNSLSSREDLLSPHEHVIRVGVFLVEKGHDTNHKTSNLETQLWTDPHKLVIVAIGMYKYCTVIDALLMEVTFSIILDEHTAAESFLFPFKVHPQGHNQNY